ncbi:MAG TPA: phosphatidylglycerophosphatase A [Bryobacteraceae bacterium]|jgi:phosphatidylglycerophosphatase A|nr:phosphatidylglycerophosphatase A [Bryobacteraceae bacterium]
MKRTGSAWMFATWFGCGYSGFAPGTVGSLAAIALAWLFSRAGFGRLQFLILSMALLYPAIRAASIVAAESGRKDPQMIVIDEVLGQWLTLAGALRFDLLTLGVAFALFRLFDIWKPPPIRLIEQIPGGAGIVLDDMMAGAYGALVLFLVGWFNHH